MNRKRKLPALMSAQDRHRESVRIRARRHRRTAFAASRICSAWMRRRGPEFMRPRALRALRAVHAARCF